MLSDVRNVVPLYLEYACIQISSRFSTYHIALTRVLTVTWWIKVLSCMTRVYSGVHTCHVA